MAGDSGDSPITGGAKEPPTKKAEERENEDVETEEENRNILNYFCYKINLVLGLTAMIVIGSRYSIFISTLHENDMWFSEISELEREISFRTESGLYYSYYKQMVNAPSVSKGINSLMEDNLTEYKSVINVLARMNIYQEVLLGMIYRNVPFIKDNLEPIYFYIYSIFGLHGFLISALYITSWVLSGTWVAGVLAALFYIFNKVDTTRVEFVIPLRESFALPFLWGQILLITCYLRPSVEKNKQKFYLIGILACTFCFAITWQFNQFVLLLQAMALFGVQALDMAPLGKIANLYIMQLLAMTAVYILQFFNPIIITGLLPYFLLGAFAVMYLQKRDVSRGDGIFSSAIKIILYILLVFSVMLIGNKLAKLVAQHADDEHIYKFALSKFGFGHSRDFDVNLYVCNGAFTFLSWDTFERLTRGLVFPPYAVYHALSLPVLALALLQKWRFGKIDKGLDEKQRTRHHWFKDRPEMVFHLIQTVFFGAMAITTLRMKYLWTPYMCIMAAVALGDYQTWFWFTSKIFKKRTSYIVNIGRHIFLLAGIGALLYVALPPVLKELDELREFYDPDTVELMEWIKAETPKKAAFTGSMQLLAGVKLCTGRAIANHPHYEDRGLRTKTFELYQMYAKRPPAYVHSYMKYHGASYIILEDSICRAPSRDGCRLPDLMDKANGHIPDNGEAEDGLYRATHPRFCEEIRHMRGDYKTYFKDVFKNKTFRVYKVLTIKKDQPPVIHPNDLPPVV